MTPNDLSCPTEPRYWAKPYWPGLAIRTRIKGWHWPLRFRLL